MATVEPAAADLFIGLENAETHLSDRWLELRSRAQEAAVIALVLGVQIAWLCAFAYAAYLFVF